jgi:hypothetical protein
MSIKNKFLLFFSIIILSFTGALVFLLFRTEDMIVKSLYNDFSQIANSAVKEIDSFLLNRILSLETLSHNEGVKIQMVGTDDTKNVHKKIETEEEISVEMGTGNITRTGIFDSV